MAHAIIIIIKLIVAPDKLIVANGGAHLIVTQMQVYWTQYSLDRNLLMIKECLEGN